MTNPSPPKIKLQSKMTTVTEADATTEPSIPIVPLIPPPPTLSRLSSSTSFYSSVPSQNTSSTVNTTSNIVMNGKPMDASSHLRTFFSSSTEPGTQAKDTAQGFKASGTFLGHSGITATASNSRSTTLITSTETPTAPSTVQVSAFSSVGGVGSTLKKLFAFKQKSKPFSELNMIEDETLSSTGSLALTPSVDLIATSQPSSAFPLPRFPSTGGMTPVSASAIPDNKRGPSKTTKQQRTIMSMLAPKRLFDVLAIVSLVEEVDAAAGADTRILVPKVVFRFPPQKVNECDNAHLSMKDLAKTARSSQSSLGSTTASSIQDVAAMNPSLLENMPLFCFPEWATRTKTTVEDYLKDERWYPDSANKKNTSQQHEMFSFVLTDVDGSKRHGYCRRILDAESQVEGDVPVRVPLRSNLSSVALQEMAKEQHSQAQLRKSTNKAESSVDVVDGVALMTTYIKKRKPLPVVYCIISASGCISLFSQILDLFEEKQKLSHLAGLPLDHPEHEIQLLLNALVSQVFPKPGRSLTVRYTLPLTTQEISYKLHRPVDLLNLEHVSFTLLLQCIGIQNVGSLNTTSTASASLLSPFATLVTLLTALLLERHIIFVSRSLQRLSACCRAAQGLIYPLEWQHVFIPILPRKLVDFACSPTPYIIGMLSEDVQYVIEAPINEPVKPGQQTKRSATLPIDDALVINLDSGRILRHDTATQDRNVIPTYLLTRLKAGLEDALRISILTEDSTSMSVKPGFLHQRNSSATSNISTLSRSTASGTSPTPPFIPPPLPSVPSGTSMSIEKSGTPTFHVEPASLPQSTQSSPTRQSVSSTASADVPTHKRNAAIGHAFMKLFFLLLGPYRDYMEVDVTEDKNGFTSVESRPEMSEWLRQSSKVRVRFDSDEFVKNHPLVVGQDSVWLSDAGSKQPGASVVPNANQRASLRAFLNALSATQNFQFFIQEREEAFQYHYQLQLDETRAANGDIKSLETVLSQESSTSKKAGKKDLPAGLKNYYLLAQSTFEKKVTLMEMKFQERMTSKIIE